MKKILTIIGDRYPDNPNAAEHFAKLLVNYHNSHLAPPNMLSELETNDDGKYWAHMWEALLYHHIKSLGFALLENKVKKSGQKGPDFGIQHNGGPVWIEAITPAPIGIPAEYLEPFDDNGFKAFTVPHEQKLLRWTAAIKEKSEKFRNYLQNGIIPENSRAIIAVNSCRLQDFAFDDMGISRLPYAVEATLPIGPLSIPLSKEGLALGRPENSIRHSVYNKNNAEISTEIFLNPHYSHISAVIGTHQRDIWNRPLHLSLVHNPLALNALEPKILGAAKEFVCEDNDTHYVLRDLHA
jgi:type I restriction enzyme S subunit